ncbi:MAG: DNA-directed RNA polymerase subunit A'' [Candidatus Aenigmarchaeota archaeon]|nr:DNA-directed RNA polymerase subunit A'' [Candidatus Aenigmarchaeota archaeon]
MSKELQMSYLDNVDLPQLIWEEIDKVSKDRKLNEQQKEKLINSVKKEYMKSSFEPGEALGIISAQSISEPATQMTMRTYHFAGSAGLQITLGLPRLIEIFDARKEPTTPMMTLYLKSKFNTKEDGEEIAKQLREKKMRNFSNTISVDLTNKKIKIELKKIKQSEKKETMEKLEKTFKNYTIKLNGERIDIEPKEGEITIKELEKLKKKILALHVSGLQGIKNSVLVKEGKDWIIKTLGSNFEKILLMEEFDIRKCYTNNIHEIAKFLGIEAARTALMREIRDTLEQQGLDIDQRHIMLVADIMTLTGEIRAVGRYGIAGTHTSVLTRAGFEETVKHLVKASVRGEIDTFEGIFDNVMINKQIPVGTGMFELVAKIGEE